MNYTYLHYGDRLPTVGVLQKLLKRAGEKPDVDGVFGPETLAAVRHFQLTKRLNPDGIVGKHTWQRLVEGLHLRIFDCVDVFDAFQKEEFLRAGNQKAANEKSDSYAGEVDDIRSVGGKPFIIGGMSNGVQQAVSMICSTAKNAFLLRFHGHGYPGSVGIGAGSGGPDELNRINAGIRGAQFCTLPPVHSAVSRLKSVFGPYGSLQLMSCETAEGDEGRELLRALTFLVQVPVTAGLETQYGGSGIDTFKFEGPTFTAIPNGRSLKDWCRALPDIH
jgi:peptidoglycan hydrolase-like protein with peptidoglycan-binding domain